MPPAGPAADSGTRPEPAGQQATRHTGTAGPAAGDLRTLITGLIDRSGELFGVTDTAQVLAEDLVERGEADAAAVLVPDGSIWRVSGQVGLHPREQRATLAADHWLITQIALGGQVLLLQDTELARPKLAGAPLATWRHLLAVPIRQVQALIMLARGPAAQPFGESDLMQLIGPISEAAGLLTTAMQTRQLARLLSSMQEADPPEIP